MPSVDVETPHGTARAHLRVLEQARGALALGHGASAGFDSRDLTAAADAALAESLSVALVEQPYRVAGRRGPPPPAKLDEAWLAALRHLREGPLAGLALVVGGRSLGARVACRTAAESEAVGVLCLAFPEHPPGKPEKSRQPELDAVAVPTLVVQGDSDPFGMPRAGPNHEIVVVPGTHSLDKSADEVAAAVRAWLPGLVA